MTYANAAWDERPTMVTRTSSMVKVESHGSKSVSEEPFSSEHSQSYTNDLHARAIVDLFQVFLECSEQDWDGYGAKEVEPAALLLAIGFLDKLPRYIATPEIAADPDGEISFEWFRADDTILTLSISSEGKLSFAGIFGKDKPHGIENYDMGQDIPSDILWYLSRYFGNVIFIMQS